MSYDELRQAVARAIEEGGHSQAQIAREIGVTRGAISRAAKESGDTLWKLQARIIEHLTGSIIEKEITFRVRGKSKGSEPDE